jgi:hypothetical protein
MYPSAVARRALLLAKTAAVSLISLTVGMLRASRDHDRVM